MEEKTLNNTNVSEVKTVTEENKSKLINKLHRISTSMMDDMGKYIAIEQEIESLSLPSVSGSCSWVYDNIEEKWNTDCGQSHLFNCWGLPIDHDHKFCPYCGKEIKSSCR